MRSLQQIPTSDAQVSLPTFAIGKVENARPVMSWHDVACPTYRLCQLAVRAGVTLPVADCPRLALRPGQVRIHPSGHAWPAAAQRPTEPAPWPFTRQWQPGLWMVLALSEASERPDDVWLLRRRPDPGNLVTKLHHAALVGFDLRQMEGDVSV